MRIVPWALIAVYPWMMTENGTGGVATPDPRVARTRKDVLRAATTLLFDEGLDALSHRHVAHASGYSRATIYSHWPTRADLLVDAFSPYAEIGHPAATGKPHDDLVNDLLEFRRIMIEYRVDRALGLLCDLTVTVPELLDIRRRVVLEGEWMIRDLLATRLSGVRLDAGTHMLVGLFLNSALLHGEVPTRELIEASVDLLLPATG